MTRPDWCVPDVWTAAIAASVLVFDKLLDDGVIAVISIDTRDAAAVPIARAIMAAVAAEKSRIVECLEQEADVTPCHEDAMVVASCAVLVLADFSYDEAEKIELAREAATTQTGA